MLFNQNDQEMGDYQLTFYANIESFSGITIGKGAGEDCWKEWLIVSEDSISVYDVETNQVLDEATLNLEYKDYISIVIQAELDGKATVEVCTNGGSFLW